MRPNEIATQADNKVAQAPDPEFVDEVYSLDPPQEAETAVREYEWVTGTNDEAGVAQAVRKLFQW